MPSSLDPAVCGPTGHHLRLLLAIAARPGAPIAGIAGDAGTSPEEVAAILDGLLADGYLTRRPVDGGDLYAVDEEAPLRGCGCCAGGRLGDVLALARLRTDDGDVVAFSRAVERLAWGSRRPR